MNPFIPSTALIYKNFAAWKGISHIGLGVSAALNAAEINKHIGPAEVIPAQNNVDIVNAIRKYNDEHEEPLTNIIISAPWISVKDTRAMVTYFKDIQFTVLSHSNVGFLQADPNGIHLLREGLKLSQELPNFKISGNSRKFVEWMQVAYGVPVVLLPNMYPVKEVTTELEDEGVIKIGNFGAIRPQKNVLTATAAAVAIGREMQRPVEMYINSGREEGGVWTLMNALHQLIDDVPNFELKQAPWCSWSEFKEDYVANMDLLIQVSYTESFNMVTADGISVGVPSVVSDAIDWAPTSWRANNDDCLDVAKVGIRLLTDDHTRNEGFKYLTKHNKTALKLWTAYLMREPIQSVGELAAELGF